MVEAESYDAQVLHCRHHVSFCEGLFLFSSLKPVVLPYDTFQPSGIFSNSSATVAQRELLNRPSVFSLLSGVLKTFIYQIPSGG